MNLTKPLFKTSDLYFASFLKTAGFDLHSIDKSPDGKKKFFVFEDTNNLVSKVQTEYVNGQAKVSAKDLIDNIRALKTLTNMS